MPLPWKRHKPSQSEAEEAQRSHTEKIAYELSQTRQLLKRPGDQNTDWETAEKIIKNPVRKVLYRCHRPFIRLEKNTWEPLLSWANNQALLSLLGLVGNIGLIIAVATYIGSEKQRRNAEVLNAWQTITSAHGQAGSGGRIQALEFLNASPGANWRRKFPWVCAPLSLCLWPAESLAGVDLSVDGFNSGVSNSQSELNEKDKDVEGDSSVYLKGIQLPGADLRNANLEGADLSFTNLEGADLWNANLEGAELGFANLEGANLRNANLEGAELIVTNLEGANLSFANLEGADLMATNLEGANLSFANLKESDWSFTPQMIEYIILSLQTEGTNLEGADLQNEDPEVMNNVITQQLSQTQLCGTQLPADIDLPPDRDCEEFDFIDP